MNSTAQIHAIEDLQNTEKTVSKMPSCRISDSEIPEYRRRERESRQLLLEKGLFSEYIAKRISDEINLEKIERVKKIEVI